MTLPKIPPLPQKRLDQLASRVEESIGNSGIMVGICVHADDDLKSQWVTAGDVAALLQEVARRRRKMGYVEK